jgi:hypothetical protein
MVGSKAVGLQPAALHTKLIIPLTLLVKTAIFPALYGKGDDHV